MLDSLRAEDEHASHRLASVIASRGFAGQSSLLASALSQALAHRILRATSNPSQVVPFFDWLERTCTALPLDVALADMIRSAIEHARPTVRPYGRSHETLATLERGINDIVDRRKRELSRPRLDDELDGTIAAFLVRLDEADPLSAEHSRSVSLWCRRLAAKLNLDEDTCRFAARAGMLHDVGKARTPTEILHAPRALTDSEWIVMRDHTVAGSRMLAEVAQLRPFESAARSHHERLDGRGYPDRLEAPDIPLVVRIVTVADSFNAMIGRRPYRLPLSPAQALEQLDRHRATQFDPRVVDAMVAVVEH